MDIEELKRRVDSLEAELERLHKKLERKSDWEEDGLVFGKSLQFWFSHWLVCALAVLSIVIVYILVSKVFRDFS